MIIKEIIKSIFDRCGIPYDPRFEVYTSKVNNRVRITIINFNDNQPFEDWQFPIIRFELEYDGYIVKDIHYGMIKSPLVKNIRKIPYILIIEVVENAK